jgi:hypothetical protein
MTDRAYGKKNQHIKNQHIKNNTIKIFVGNVPYQCTQKEFSECFKMIEGFVSAELITVYKSNMSRGFGFITLRNINDYNKLKQQSDIIFKGRVLRFTTYQKDKSYFNENANKMLYKEDYPNINDEKLQYLIECDKTYPDILQLSENISSENISSENISSENMILENINASPDIIKSNTNMSEEYMQKNKRTDDSKQNLNIISSVYDQNINNSVSINQDYIQNNYIYVDNIPDGKNRDWLRSFFAQYEPIGRCFISMNHETGKLKNDGLVEIIDDSKFKHIIIKKYHEVNGIKLDIFKYKIKSNNLFEISDEKLIKTHTHNTGSINVYNNNYRNYMDK